MNIYQKLVEVRKAVPYLQKENKGYQFNYVSSSQVLASLKSKMDAVGLLLIPSITSSKVKTDVYDKQDNRGNIKRTVDYFTELEIDFTWVNTENPEEQIKCHWYGQGLDTAGEKGVGIALTYAEKYFMLKFFNIPTDKDDPDSFQGKQGTPLESPKKPTNPKKTEVATNTAVSKGTKAKLWNLSQQLGMDIKQLEKYVKTCGYDLNNLKQVEAENLISQLEKPKFSPNVEPIEEGYGGTPFDVDIENTPEA